MKPRYLRFCGINSFSEPAEIDFSALLDYGVFGIFGDTGSGKSTILDCIGFALYGNVARSRAGSIADIINYRADEAFVVFEFEIVYKGERKIFRVERTLKRKNAAQSVVVYEKKEGLITVASSVREANALLQEIVGLEQKDFEKCIALPQGEFAQFVKAPRADRLKLIARLFDLEKYGELLNSRLKEQKRDSEMALALARERLAPYAEATEEQRDLLAARVEKLKGEELRLRTELEAANAEEKRLAALLERKREAEAAAEKFAALEARRPAMEELGAELSRLEKASAVEAAKRQGIALKERRDAAEEALAKAEEDAVSAGECAKKAAAFDAEKADAEIENLVALEAHAKAAAEKAARKEEAKRKLDEVIRKNEAEKLAFVGFSYEAQRAELDEKIASLGQGDLFAYVETHGKAALLAKEYTQFASEVEQLTEKHPEIAPDSEPIIRKYRAGGGDGGIDLNDIRRSFEADEKERKALEERRLELERINGKYNVHKQRLSQLASEYARLKEEIDSYGETEAFPPVDEIGKKLGELRAEKRRREEEKRIASEAQTKALAARAAAEESMKHAQTALAEGRERFKELLAEGGFSTAEEAAALVRKHGNAADARKEYETFRFDHAAALARVREIPPETAECGEADLQTVREKIERLGEARERALSETAVTQTALTGLEEKLEKKKGLEKEYAACKKRDDLLDLLKKYLEGNKFMEFAAEEYLQRIAVGAGGRLLSLTGGRYFLRYDKGFFVGDNFNGGKPRGVHTLSGGETFLVSLSLALALGAEICARSLRPIEFFFLDEGFGTLDATLVDVVMDSLEKLRGEHFSIGIISHVEELKHRIDRRLIVHKADERHGSQIFME